MDRDGLIPVTSVTVVLPTSVNLDTPPSTSSSAFASLKDKDDEIHVVAELPSFTICLSGISTGFAVVEPAMSGPTPRA